MTRTYHSPARQEAKRDTRERILDAVVEVVTRDGVHAFTVQSVADAAGVAHRTVYRHFATREDLLDGLDELLERRGRDSGLASEPPELEADDLPNLVRRVYRSFEAFRDAMRAYVVISIALGRRVPTFDRRTRAFRECVARRFPRLTPEEVEEAAGVIRLLAGSRTWYLLTSEQGMSTDAASRAASRAIEVLLADLADRSKNPAP
jgi:AcrR family transcriptional regulator